MTDSNELSLFVQKSLDEDIGSGDITSDLIPDDKIAKAFVLPLGGKNADETVLEG